MNVDKYNHFTVDNWIQDPSFRDYILEEDHTNVELWNSFNTEGKVSQNMAEASKILMAMRGLRDRYWEEGEKMAGNSLDQLQTKIHARTRQARRRIVAMVAAAASMAIGVLVVWLWVTASEPMHYMTAANETEEVQLPDGSIVFLNENSSLTVNPGWGKSDREVQLTGVAYFMVKSVLNTAGNKTKFTVRTNGLDIEVLGTKFNVNTSRLITSVSLDEGSVKLVKNKDPDIIKPSFLEPGQVAFYNHDSEEIKISEKELTTEQAFWKPKTIEFNQITLRNAVDKMEVVFDIEFRFKDKSMLDETIQKLSVPNDNPEVFINTVNILFDGRIEIRKDIDTNIYYIQQPTTTIQQ